MRVILQRLRAGIFALLLATSARSEEDSVNDTPAEPEYRTTVREEHAYYTLHLYKHNAENMFDRHLVNLTAEPDARTHDFLSNHSQAAEAVDPGFEFPFYGHTVDRFYVTTHGFLSFAPRLHNLMYKTQYIAPLRVKLDPSASKYATVDYLAREDRLTVQWTNVSVADPYAHPMGGQFSFQVTLHENGDIYFVYLEVPELLNADALYDDQPVAGLSDAFLIGDSELHVYHTVNVGNPDIMSQTVVKFTAKPTCIQQQSCEECAVLRENSDFACTWCSKVHRCSDGADRLREHWDAEQCHANNVTGADACSRLESEDAQHTEWRSSNMDRRDGEDGSRKSVPLSGDTSGGGVGVGTVASAVISAVLLLAVLGLVLGFVYLYGKGNPGGFAERLAMRMEANYKRFGGETLGSGAGGDVETTSVEMGRRKVDDDQSGQVSMTKQENNNSITVAF